MIRIGDGGVRRVAVVTGGTRGIGAAITELLAASGTHVAAAFMSNAVTAETLRDRVIASGGSVSVHRGDIGDPEICAALIDDVVSREGHVDYLIHNAGALVENPVSDTTLEQWRTALDVNLSAAFYLTRAALPAMVQRGFGRIVYVSSVTSFMGSPVEAAYGAAKAGLVGLTRSVAREVARQGVTVNCVIPGIFETDMTGLHAGQEPGSDTPADPDGPPGRSPRTRACGPVPRRRPRVVHHRKHRDGRRRHLHGWLTAPASASLHPAYLHEPLRKDRLPFGCTDPWCRLR